MNAFATLADFSTDDIWTGDIPLDFEGQDELDAENAEFVREALTGLPARPGTIRR